MNHITRIEVIGETGREFSKWLKVGCYETHIQDEGRTLKLFQKSDLPELNLEEDSSKTTIKWLVISIVTFWGVFFIPELLNLKLSPSNQDWYTIPYVVSSTMAVLYTIGKLGYHYSEGLQE